MEMRSPVAKFMHKANNRYAVHKNKRESLLADAMDKELDESLFIESESQGNEDNYLDDVGCSGISISNVEERL